MARMKQRTAAQHQGQGVQPHRVPPNLFTIQRISIHVNADDCSNEIKQILKACGVHNGIVSEVSISHRGTCKCIANSGR
jgi:hypothetical protein